MRSYLIAAMALAVALVFSTTGFAQVPGSKAVPADVVQEWKAGERIFIRVFVDSEARPDAKSGETLPTYPYGEHYGNRIADIVPMHVQIFTVTSTDEKLPPVKLDFAALRAGRLTLEEDQEKDPDWFFAKTEALAPGQEALVLPNKPQSVKLVTPDGKRSDAELWDIRLYVQHKRIPEPLIFWFEYTYATKLNENGQTEWEKDSTPDFVISGSWTSDKGRDMLVGNTNLVEQTPPINMSIVFMGLGALMTLVPAGLVTARVLTARFNQPKQAADIKGNPEIAWAVFAPIMTRTTTKNGFNFDEEDVHAVTKAFKDYIGITGGITELESTKYLYDQGEEIYQVLYSLEHQILERDALRKIADNPQTRKKVQARFAELMKRIEQVCPRP